jgi:hypothetical protein
VRQIDQPASQDDLPKRFSGETSLPFLNAVDSMTIDFNEATREGKLGRNSFSHNV